MAERERSYLSRAIRHYSSLFTFPSYPMLLASMFIIVITITVAVFLIISFSQYSLLRGFAFALGVLLLPTVCADHISSLFVKDSILNLRRLTALSAVTTITWAFMVVASAAVQIATGSTGFVRLFFFGASLIIGFRFLVVRSVASLRPLSYLAVVLLQPGLCLIAAIALWSPTLPPFPILAIIVSTSLLALAGESLLRILDRHGEKTVGAGALRLFQSFASDWMAGIAGPLEQYLEEIAVATNTSTCLLEFTGSNGTQGLIVVPDIHPGPFKNVGSSNIPYEIQTALEGKLMAPVVVPHGASGHERDLASKKNCEKLVNSLSDAVMTNNFSAVVSPMVRRDSGEAHASCQFFGDIALVTLTCAPQSMEDVPFELGREIIEKGKVLGARDVIVIDAHNSIGGTSEIPILPPEQLSDLKAASELAIEACLKTNMTRFKFGASRIIPVELGLREGLGPGGIATVVIEAREQKMAYVTFDGNNMVRGLREEVRETLRDLVDDSEVLATDTHVVNGISTIERGYHPVGEVGSRERLLSHVRSCTREALSRLQESRAVYRRISVSEVLVLGEDKLRSLSLLVDSSIALLKRLMLLTYVPTIVLTALMFFLLS